MGVPAYTQAQTQLSDVITNYILQIHLPGYPIVFEVSLPILVNRYIGMYPRGERRSTDCLALGLYLESLDELFIESRKVVQITLSILDQKTGKYFTRTTG